MKIDLKDNIRLIIAFMLLIAVLLWVCNKQKWRNKEEPRKEINKGMYAVSVSNNNEQLIKKSITPHDL
jgi:hypothetical protein